MKRYLLFILLAVANLSACAPASGTLTISDAWARPASKGENGAVYFVIQNNTASDDALINASTDIASTTEAHMSMMNDQGVASMQMQEAAMVPAGENTAFKPGGLHIMMVSLKQDLKVGDTFILTLQFEKAAEISLLVEVKE